MPNGNQLKNISIKRLEAAKILFGAGDWDGSGQMLGLALECALKSACCKALRLTEYPATRKKDGDSHFKTHSFDTLLTVSGCEDLFRTGGEGGFAWSDFTSPFADKGKWVEMRYEESKFGEQDIKDLIQTLESTELGKEGIFTILTKHERW